MPEETSFNVHVNGKEKVIAKPIFMVGLPKGATKENIDNVASDLKAKMPEYHSLVFDTTGTEFTFQAFYEKDFNEVKYEELKQIIKDNVK